jgi:voltage-gated potassium channel
VSFGDRVLKQIDRINFWRAIRLILIVDASLVLAAAILVRIVEPATFKSIGSALWWSVVTVGTVGYGDLVPESELGRAVASAAILFSAAFIPLVTSLVVAALVRRQQDRQHADLREQLTDMSARLAAIEAELKKP